MKPELRPITKLTLASTTALFLLATPLAVDWRTLDIDTVHAEAKGEGGKGGSGGGDGAGGLGGLGGAVGNAAGAVGDAAAGAAGAVGDAAAGAAGAVGDAADGAAGAAGDAAGAAGDAAGDAGGAVGDAADGASGAVGDAADGAAGAVGDAADGASGAVGDATGTVGDTADSVADGATDSVDAGDSSGSGELSDGSTPADDTASDEAVAETGEPAEADEAMDEAPDAIDTAADAVEPAPEVVDEAVDAVSETAPEVGATNRAALRSPRVTVSVTTIRRQPARGDGDDKRHLVGSPSVTSTATVELPPDDATARGLAAIEPSAGPVLPGVPQPQASGSTECATGDGRQQGTEISCLVAGSEEVRTRQIAYAPADTDIDGQTPDATTNRRIAPSVDKRPDGPSFYDELYGLQQVEARRYADGDMPVLMVQGIVSNMSNGQRSVPPLLAIVQDEQGKELLRWTFRAEAETLGPGGSTGFRSEMFDPQSESAKVTIVFAAEQQAMP